MLWALTTPSPDERTDFGEIEPLIVFINCIFVSAETTSPWAGKEMAQSEVIRINARNRFRIPKLY
jgi:hypothetical protein